MGRITVSTSLLATFVLAFGLASCTSKAPESSSTPAAGQSTGGHEEHRDHLQGVNGQSEMEKMKAELAKLSAEDAASAEKQHFCPVSGEMLGTTGPPRKVDVNGQQVWICCDDCRDDLLANPDQYLAKLKKE